MYSALCKRILERFYILDCKLASEISKLPLGLESMIEEYKKLKERNDACRNNT